MNFSRFRDSLIVKQSDAQPVDSEIIDALANEAVKKAAGDKSINWILFDFRKIAKLDSSCYLAFFRCVGQLALQDFFLGIFAEPEVRAELTKRGLDSVISVFSGEDEFILATTEVRTQRTRTFIRTFVTCAHDSLQKTLECPVTQGEVRLIGSHAQLPSLQVGAFAGIVSAPFSGSVFLGFDTESFRKAMVHFLQGPVEEITPDIIDGAAELLNVIIGHTKIKLSGRGFEMKQVIPNVVTGERIDITTKGHSISVLVPFSFTDGQFFIAIVGNGDSNMELSDFAD